MSAGGARARRALASAIASLLVVDATSARAQSSCAPRADDARTSIASALREWPSPLDRPISLRGRELSLRDALDRVAAAARIRLSYSAELLPLDQRVCFAFESASAGHVLSDLLAATSVEPVVAGAEQVVLAPVVRRVAPAAGTGIGTVAQARTVGMLDRVVVTGTVLGASQRSLPIGLDVVSGSQLEARDAGLLSRGLDGVVPGLWIWEQAPSALLARYGSIRGASSFGVSYPKIYIDGIEVANPLLVTEIDPQSVERVEVIRGPQGAALYGADAISGVINIVTRHDGLDGGAPRAQLRTTAGVSGSDFSAGTVVAQTHSLALRAGSGVRSAGLGLTFGSLGEYVPGGESRRIIGTGTGRMVRSRMMLSGVARFFSEHAGAPSNPILTSTFTGRTSTGGPGGPPPNEPADSASEQSVRQYTVGGSASFQQTAQLTHSVVIGIDGYRLTDASSLGLPFSSAADSALRAARGGADRGTVRVSSVVRLGAPDRTAATLTLGAEHASVRQESEAMESRGPGGGGPPGTVVSSADVVDWRSNSGVIAQAAVSARDMVFVTAGMRFEHLSDTPGIGRVVSLPMVGASVVMARDAATVKLRGAYGKGIRQAQTTTRQTTWLGMRQSTVNLDLGPEEQSGVEVGADLFFGRRVAVHVTRFDQQASGLIQPVAIGAEGDPRQTGRPQHVVYQLQNVGAINNDGWEMQGSIFAGGLSLSGTLSLVESRVERLARGYTGDLRPGDRMLEVPSRTASLTGAWTRPRWSTTWTLSRASDWVNYDRIALADALAGPPSAPGRGVIGPQLRAYWLDYDGVTRLRATFSRSLIHDLALVFSGDNLLGSQRGEPDNVTVVPGRTISAGVKARF